MQSSETARSLGLVPVSHGLGPSLLLWHGDLDRRAVPASTDPLSDAEAGRMRRFRFERDARRYRAAHTMLRLILGSACGKEPREVQWRIGEFGKPHLQECDALHFNMSHSGAHLLIAVAEGAPVGVDIETGATLGPDDRHELARQVFATPEIDALQAIGSAEQRGEAFLRCWARKEACLKALGSGLTIEPATFEAGLGPGRADVRIPVGDRHCLMALDSVCVEGNVPSAVAVLAAESVGLAR